MRAPIYTLVSVIALLAALWSSSLGAFDPGPASAPLLRDGDAAEGAPAAPGPAAAELQGPSTAARSGSTAGAAVPPSDAQRAAAAGDAGAGARPYAATAWAAYDPRAERNARYRAECLPRALRGVTAEDTSARQRVAYAISLETAAVFSELDERRESSYVPDDGQRHPLTFLEGHHSVACGGANYLFAEGRFPLYDELVRLEDASASSPELLAWSHACPLEAALRARCDEALQRLAAYR